MVTLGYFFGVFNHFEYTWTIMKGKVFNLVCIFKINCGKSIFYHDGLSAKKQRRKKMSRRECLYVFFLLCYPMESRKDKHNN